MQRQIYTYWDGHTWRRADPMDIWIQLQEHPEYNAEVHAPLVDAGDTEAIQVTCEAVRDVFGVADYDPEGGTGLTLGEQIGLLTDYYLYLEEQKKTAASWRTSPSSTAGSTSSPSSERTTTDTSSSGPTGPESTTDGPTPPDSA